MYKSIIYNFALFIVVCLVFLWGYIRIKYHFWCSQPVFHIYDYSYYLWGNGIINEDVEVNRYCNFKDIYNEEYSKISKLQKENFQHLIYLNYAQSDIVAYRPKLENIDPYFEGHNGKCYISLYYKDKPMRDNSTRELITTKTVVGALTTRPLIVDIFDKKVSAFTCGYVDYLCVDKNNRKQNIAPELIQTTYYHTRNKDLQTKIYIFKREGDLTYIVPLCIYKCYSFNMMKWKKPLDFIICNVSIQEVNKSTLHLIVDFLKENLKKKYDIAITPSIGNLLALINSQNVYIYYLLMDDEIKALYIFRNTCASIKNIGIGIDCIGSINITKTEFFIQGYKIALWRIIEKYPDFKYNVVEDTSDNNIIIDNLLLKTRPFTVFPSAYYFYNYISKSYPSKKVFIIN